MPSDARRIQRRAGPARGRSRFRGRGNRRFKGQKQLWFLFHLVGDDSDVCLDVSHKPEFDRWRWVDYWEPLERIVAFKREVYVSALKELEPMLQQEADSI